MIIMRMMWGRLTLMISGVLISFLLLLGFIDLLNELPEVSSTGYTFAQSLLVIALGSPTYFYEIAPIAVLIGAIVVLAQMASHNEYTVLRAAGYSMRNALFNLLSFGCIAVVLVFLVGELLAPYTFDLGQKARFTAKGQTYSGRFLSGVWLKDKPVDGRSRILNIAQVDLVDQISGVTIYNLDAQARLTSMISARSGNYLGGNQWRLNGIASTSFVMAVADTGAPMVVTSQHSDHFDIKTDITPEILRSLFIEPDRMSMLRLYQTTRHLEATGQVDARYQISFYKRLMYPFSILVMLFLALPFAYLHARKGGLGLQIFVGIILGVVFLNLNAFFSNLGALNNWSPFFTASAPAMIFMLGSLVALYWVERR